MYCCLEGNYIENTAIQEKIDQGVMITFQKVTKIAQSRSGKGKGVQKGKLTDAKVRLLTLPNGCFNQNEGVPPDAEDAPAPKPVYDYKGGEKGKGKGKVKSVGRGSGEGKADSEMSRSHSV